MQTGGFFVMDWLLAFFAGIGIGWMLHDSGRPLRLRRAQITLHEFKPGVVVAPVDHIQQWQTWTHRYICLAEVLERERGTRKGWLPSYTLLRRVTGQTWRCFGIYNDILESGGLVEIVERGGIRWLVGRSDRRAALTALPYPDGRPPRFNFTRPERDSVIGVSG